MRAARFNARDSCQVKTHLPLRLRPHVSTFMW
jgi:hypothetical protein